jgi:hypothetical protein
MPEIMQYVGFNRETGKIFSIGNENTRPELSYIRVPLKDVILIKQGIERQDNYYVRYNTKTKDLELASRAEEMFDASSVNDFIYEIPVTELEDPDICITQDIPNTCWKIEIGKVLKKNVREKGIRLNASMVFSITAKGDPNVLYKTLIVQAAQAVSDNYSIVPFSMPFEMTSEPISIYTARKFDTYQFKRIYE